MKIFFFYFVSYVINCDTPTSVIETKNDLEFIEKDLEIEYGTIIFKEKIEHTEIVVYLCCKSEILTVIHVNSKNYNIVSVGKNFLKKKKIKRPKIKYSTSIKYLNLRYLKNKFNSSLKLQVLRDLVKNWDNYYYNFFLTATPNYISEIWPKI